MPRSPGILLCAGTLACLTALYPAIARRGSHPTPPAKAAHAQSSAASPMLTRAYAQLPLTFESNQGQTDKQVLFLSHGHDYSLFLTATQAVLTLHKPQQQAVHSPHSDRASTSPGKGKAASHATALITSVLRLKLLGANSQAQVEGAEPQPGVVNYFLGADPSKWRTNVATYGRVRYKGVYPGIDMVYYGNQRQLEYDWVVAPGADVRRIQLDVEGAQTASLSSKGDLRLQTAAGEVVQHAPVVYQEFDGRRQSVSARLALQTVRNPQTGLSDRRVGFAVAAYDHSRPLVIDPVLVYSTYLGGSDSLYGDSASAIAVDSQGNAYVAGKTSSTDFPLLHALQSVKRGSTTAFVSKLNAAGSALVYSTYLGGSGDDSASAIAVDSQGAAYVAGKTSSTDFPLQNALQSVNHAGSSGTAFVSKLNAAGSALVYSTYLGGSGDDSASTIAVDSGGAAYVAGNAASHDFPLKNALQSVNYTGFSGTAFVSKLNVFGSALVYSTYLGGSGEDSASAIAVDSQGAAYVAGHTFSSDFPLKNALQSVNHGGGGNAFVSKLNADGSALVYSTYLGGSIDDYAYGIAVDSGGNAYVTGHAYSHDFPLKNALQSVNHSNSNGTVFVSKLNVFGSALVYSTYLGGSGGDQGFGIAVDSGGAAYIAGNTSSTDFPLQNALQSVNHSGSSGTAFVSKLNAAGSALVYSTYLGGSETDFALGIAVDSQGAAYVTGTTGSTDFPVQSPLQITDHSPTSGNAFVARIGGYTWQTVDITVGADNKTRLLWHDQTGKMNLWSVTNTGSPTVPLPVGPFNGYATQALAAGPDGLTRLLWHNVDGTAVLWMMNADNTKNRQYPFGPFPGWTAVDVAVGSDNNTRLLWVNTDGSIVVWTVSPTGTHTQSPVYGPFPGYAATHLSAGGDGLTRVLWHSVDGTTVLWLIKADYTYLQYPFASISGWSATDVAVGADNNTRLLWTDAGGRAVVWTVTGTGNVTKGHVFGPFPGWSATHLAAGSDGLTRLLWFSGDGTQALWQLNADNTQQNQFKFGPF